MVKILHLIGKFDEDGGGAQRVILDIINTCDKPELQMGVCSLFGQATLSKHLPSGVFNANLNCTNRYNPKILFYLYKLMLEWKPDILHVHSSVTGVFGRPIAKILGIKIISSVQNDVRNAPYRNKVIDKLTIGFSDSILCASGLVEESVVEAYGHSVRKKSEISVISNCLDCSKFKSKIQSDPNNKINGLGLSEAAYIVGTIGRLHPLKGHKYLIKAWSKVSDTYPNAVLLIIGAGEELTALQNLVQDLRLTKSVHFLGARNDIPDILTILDLFVFPSLSEGFGVALLEAMCMGKIIIASDIKPLNKILGDSGILVPSADAHRLEQKLIEVFGNFETHKELGIKAKHRVLENFSPEEFGRKYLSVYEKYI